MTKLIHTLLREVDRDIRKAMLEKDEDGYEAWEHLPDATNTILAWQAMRERNRQ
jgi:hypothetical protein